ncbi:MAG: helix-turn-helix domain-containing protein, partial [Bacteroidales bacterium]|nr:helix-turn-helix domain-containing protein [Bacteroidales bacterium]
MYRHHNFEERLNIISRLIAGESLKGICREASLNHHMVRQWYLRYRKYGEQGLLGTRSYHYTGKTGADWDSAPEVAGTL